MENSKTAPVTVGPQDGKNLSVVRALIHMRISRNPFM